MKFSSRTQVTLPWSKRSTMAYKLEETSCSTWMAAQNNFWDCLIKSNVQLAIAHANKAADFRQQDKKCTNLRAKWLFQLQSPTPPGWHAFHKFQKHPTQPSQTPRTTVEPPSQVLDTGQPYMGKYCSNCRGKHPIDQCPRLPCFTINFPLLTHRPTHQPATQTNPRDYRSYLICFLSSLLSHHFVA